MIAATHLADLFVEAADTLVDDFDLVEFLHRLTDHVARVSGAEAVGLVLADHTGTLRFMAASNGSAEALELFQLQAEDGPCRECYLTGRPVVNADLAHAEDRWPRFAPHATAAGFASVHAFPMRLRDSTLGALNLFGAAAVHFDADDVRVVQALADVATIAILQERTATRAAELANQLQTALDRRVVIEQAKGVLAQRHGIGVEEAFTRLRDLARSSQRRIADVAAEVVDPTAGRG